MRMICIVNARGGKSDARIPQWLLRQRVRVPGRCLDCGRAVCEPRELHSVDGEEGQGEVEVEYMQLVGDLMVQRG